MWDERPLEQVHSLVKAIAGGVISTGQGSVNPVMAPLRHNKLISR